ncbi:MAG: L,D-transpeptidase [Roseiarcus sp.]
MRRVLAIGLSVLALGVGGARADAGNRGGGLGGGLLEFLATGGRTDSPALASPIHAAPPAPAPRVQTASLTPDAAEPQREIPPQFHRQEVAYDGPQAPGVIIVDTPDRYLYLVEPGGRALRYGIGVGRPGFEWAGVKTITRKAEWPGWTPPSQMLLRRPDLPRHMVGGLGNPLGARALYLGSSLYRIHGTNEPWTIGQNVSSGCIRMMNDDVIDLFNRVEVGTKVVVM